MRFAWSAVIVLGMAGWAWADDGDEKRPAAKPADPEFGLSLEEFHRRLDRLEALQDQQKDQEESERLKKAAAKEKQEEMEGLPGRVSKLEKQAAAGAQTWDAGKMLSFSSPDGNFTAKVGGRIYMNYRHIFDRNDGPPPAGAGGAPPDSFFLDTARIQVDGTFYKDFFYRVETEAQTGVGAGGNSNGLFRMKDVYVGWNMLPDALSLWGGQMKTPWSQEETCSSRFIDFAERSLLNRIAPAHDVGLLLKGSFTEKVFEWNLGVMNGALARDGGRNNADLNDEKDLVARLFVSPFKNSPDLKFFQQLRIGADFTLGQRDNQALGAGITAGDYSSGTINPFLAGAPTANGEQQRALFNFSWIHGPMSLRAEYAVVTTEVAQPAASVLDDEFDVTAWCVSAAFILTGEAKPLENRIKPARNLSLTEGTWGAFELAARIALLDTGDGEDAGVVGVSAPGVNQRTQEITVGLNWWWTPNVALRLNYVMLSFDADLPVKSGLNPLTDNVDVFYVRWQIDF